MAHDVSPGVALFVIDIHEMSRVAWTVPVIILWRMERLRDFFRVDTPTPYSNGWNVWVFLSAESSVHRFWSIPP